MFRKNSRSFTNCNQTFRRNVLGNLLLFRKIMNIYWNLSLRRTFLKKVFACDIALWALLLVCYFAICYYLFSQFCDIKRWSLVLEGVYVVIIHWSWCGYISCLIGILFNLCIYNYKVLILLKAQGWVLLHFALLRHWLRIRW